MALVACFESHSAGDGELVDIDGEAGPVRQWRAEDAVGMVGELPFFTSSSHMDACEPALEGGISEPLEADELGAEVPGDALYGQAHVQLYCASGRLLRSLIWSEEQVYLEEPCGGAEVRFGERPSFLRASYGDIGTVRLEAATDPSCARLIVCNPTIESGFVERATNTTMMVCQDPGRTEARAGTPAAWTDCETSLREATDGDLCEFEGGCASTREVVVDTGSGPRTMRHELLAWCGDGLVRIASTAAVAYHAQ
jgi:hypothetical protein